MGAPGSFKVRIAGYQVRRILSASCEGEAALRAEAVIRQIHEPGEPIGFSIESPDAAANERIARYLEEIMVEIEGLKARPLQ